VMHSRPFFLAVFNFPKYRERTRMEQITKHIPRADARWLGQAGASRPPRCGTGVPRGPHRLHSSEPAASSVA
jgi:hypothetical protein